MSKFKVTIEGRKIKKGENNNNPNIIYVMIHFIHYFVFIYFPVQTKRMVRKRC